MKLYQLKISSVNKKCLLLYVSFLLKIFHLRNYVFSKVFLPKKKKKITLLKSPHVNKKSFEHFEVKKYTVLIFLRDILKEDYNIFLNKPAVLKLKLKLI